MFQFLKAQDDDQGRLNPVWYFCQEITQILKQLFQDFMGIDLLNNQFLVLCLN